MSVQWEYFDKFDSINKKYLPVMGEGETKATQIITAVNKLIYKWYNDGDVFDNTYFLSGWANDLSSYANWLKKHTIDAGKVLDRISECTIEGEYENILKELADTLLDEEYLEKQDRLEKINSIYDCEGNFKCDFTFDEFEPDSNWY